MSRTFPGYDGLSPEEFQELVQNTGDSVVAINAYAAACEEAADTTPFTERQRQWLDVAANALGRFALLSGVSLTVNGPDTPPSHNQ